jgi:hypothetical protein
MTAQRLLAKADAAQTKAAHVAAGATAHLAAVAYTHGIFPFALAGDNRLLRHNISSLTGQVRQQNRTNN